MLMDTGFSSTLVASLDSELSNSSPSINSSHPDTLATSRWPFGHAKVMKLPPAQSPQKCNRHSLQNQMLDFVLRQKLHASLATKPPIFRLTVWPLIRRWFDTFTRFGRPTLVNSAARSARPLQGFVRRMNAPSRASPVSARASSFSFERPSVHYP